MKKELLNRIEINHNILVGKPVIKETRLSVQFILGLLAQGININEILDEYQGLSKNDILACLLFTSEVLDNNYYINMK